MRQIIGWLLVLILCSAAGGETAVVTLDARLLEARTDLENAQKAQDAGHEVQALAWAQNALRLRETALGGTHPDVAACLDVLAEIYSRNKELSQAESRLRRALTLREEAPGTSPLQVAASLDRLAAIYDRQGRKEQTVPLYERALTLREKTLGRNHLQVASALDRLALVYYGLGRYVDAEKNYHRALDIRQSSLGKDHVAVASVLQHLADLYRTWGLYEQAEALYLRALDIQEKVLGRNHPAVATTHNHLAELYEKQGLDKQVEYHYGIAFEIRKKALGEMDHQFATTLKGLASLHQRQGRYQEAEAELLRVLKIREATFGKTHPSVATVLDLLARLYWEQGDDERAKPRYEHALTLREEALGKDHISVALTHNNLARLYWKQGEDEQAERHYELARAIWEKALGSNHPFVAINLRDLARLRLTQNRRSEAVRLFAHAFAIFEQRLRQESLGFSESRLAEFLERLHESEQVFYSLVREHPDDPQVRRLALSSILLLKGRSAEETATIYRTLYQRMGPKDRSLFEKLRRLRVELADCAHAGRCTTPEGQQSPSTLATQGDLLEADLAKNSAALRALTALPSPEDIVERVAENLATQGDLLEADLAKRYSGLAALPLPKEIVERVAKSLPQGSALVEFIVYKDSPPVPPRQTPPARSSIQLRYLALVLFPDASTGAVDLGPAEPIDTAVLSLRHELSQRNAPAQGLAQELYRLVWQPLLPLLGPTRRIWLSPDSKLGLVPFAALHDGHDFLLDSFNFTYLTSGKQLLPRSQETPPSTSVIVFALPDLKTSALLATAGPPSTSTAQTSDAERSSSTAPLPRSRYDFSPLPQVEQEVQSIQWLLPQSQIFLRSQATRDRLFQLSPPGILHITTHGLFLGSDVFSDTPNRTIGTTPGDDSSSSKFKQHPLLDSLIVLADLPDTSLESFVPSAKPAFLTALELAGLNLQGTQLVVLSACQSGLGYIQPGQGVYGLRRALEIAGAETLVMSLWNVDDASTAMLMEHYYRNLLEGQGRASALREAMRTLRAIHPEPYYWAPFFAQGSDAPLRGITSEVPPAPWNDESKTEYTSRKPALMEVTPHQE